MNVAPALNQCPSEQELLAFLQGSLSLQRSDQVASHIDYCDTCVSSLQDLEAACGQPWTPLPAAQSLAHLREQGLERLAEAACQIPIGWGEPSLQSATVVPPERVGNYRLLAQIGAGGMGTVYRAEHVNLQSEMALKLLPLCFEQKPHRLNRFYREMAAVGKIRSPYVVQASDAGQADGYHYLAMELLSGADAGKLAPRGAQLPLADACEIVRQAALGLVAIDQHGLVHRDIKPSNLFVTTAGQVKLLDLGLARFLSTLDDEEELTASEHVLGTAAYMAPEQLLSSRNVDIQADIYSLGCTFYRLLSGQLPYSGEQQQQRMSRLLAHVNVEPPPLESLRPEVPQEIARLIHTMLAQEPSQRPSSPAAVAEKLEAFGRESNLPLLVAQAAQSSAESGRLQWERSTYSAPADTTSGAMLHRSSPATGSRWLRVAMFTASACLLGIGVAVAALLLPENKPPVGLPAIPAKEPPAVPAVEPAAAATTAPAPPVTPPELPFDVSNEEPLIHHALLSRKPSLPPWQPANSSMLMQAMPERRQLFMSSRTYCFARLGKIDHPRYRLQTRLVQTHWLGGVGLFIGMHDSVNEQGEHVARFQLFELRKYLPNNPEKAFAWHRLQANVRFSEAGAPLISQVGHASVPIPKPPDREQLVEIVVRGDSVTQFSWGGEILDGLCTPSTNQEFQLPDYRGDFGLCVGNSDAMFREAFVFLE